MVQPQTGGINHMTGLFFLRTSISQVLRIGKEMRQTGLYFRGTFFCMTVQNPEGNLKGSASW